MKLFFSRILPVLTGVMFLAGCMNFEYVGQSFAPRGESAPVNFIQGREAIPADQYRIIGRGVLTGPNSTDEYDRMDEIRSEARKHGADAVCFVGSKVKADGLYPKSRGAFAPPLSARTNMANINAAGVTWEADSFGKVQTLNDGQKVRYTFETKVIFLKKRNDFDREMKSRSSFL